jgi:hypothetical protein
VIDSKGDPVWSSGDPIADPAATQLISSGVPSLACIFSGPPPTTLIERGLGARELRLTAAGKPQLVDILASHSLVWEPAGYPDTPPGSYRLCVTSSGALVTQRRDGSGPPIWQGPVVPPSSPAGGPFSLFVNTTSLLVLDRSCRAVYTAAGTRLGSGARLSSGVPRRPSPQAALGKRPAPRPKAAAAPPTPPPRIKAASRKGSATKANAAKAAAPKRAPPHPRAVIQGFPIHNLGKTSSAPRRPPRMAAALEGFQHTPPNSTVPRLCGGWNLCGVDSACPGAAACPAGKVCKRANAFTWMCEAEYAPASTG